MLAAFVAVSSAFSPTALAPRSAVSLRVRSVSAPVAMAGWNDEYQTDNPGRKREVHATAHALSSALCDAHRPRACLRAHARARARRHAITHAHARTHALSWQVLKTNKGSADFDEEMARTGALGGMDSAPPAFIGLTVLVVAYLVYLVVAG